MGMWSDGWLVYVTRAWAVSGTPGVWVGLVLAYAGRASPVMAVWRSDGVLVKVYNYASPWKAVIMCRL